MKENKELKAKFERINSEIMKELRIKDLLINRHIEYEGVLKKELVMAKNILKNPTLAKKAETEMNFDRTSLNFHKTSIYPFRDIDKYIHEENGWRLKQEINKKFLPKKYSLTPRDTKGALNYSPKSDYSIFKPQEKSLMKKMLRGNERVSVSV